MLNELELHIVAEGVETAEMRDRPFLVAWLQRL